MYSLFVGVQIVLTLLYVGYLIYEYSLPQINLLIKFLVYLTWLTSFSIVVLLPYDVYHSLQQDYTMTIVWKSIYYSIFLLTWLLLPIAQEYETAGEFTVRARLKTAIINNLIIYGVFVVLGGSSLVYLSVKGKLNFDELMPMLLAASNAFGMFLVVIFLSYGLVAVPKQLWREKKYEIKLKQKQFTATTLSRKKETVLHELELKVKELFWEKNKHGETPEIVCILNLVPEAYRERWGRNVSDLGTTNIIESHKQIKALLLELGRIESRWDQLTAETFKIEDIIMNLNSPNQRIESTLSISSKYDCVNYLRWFWLCRLKLIVIPALAVLFSLFAAAVVIAEIAVFWPTVSFLNPFCHLLKLNTFISLDCSLLFVLTYIAFCVYYALFKLKFTSYYGLYWNKQTDASSLIFYAMYFEQLYSNCSRVSTPLCYNFLQIIHDNNTAFSTTMGLTDSVPAFRETFYYIFPILLLVLILLNVFDVHARVFKRFGIEKFQFEPEFAHENIDEGKILLQKARQIVESKVLNSTTKDLRDYRSYTSEVPTCEYSTELEKEANIASRKNNSESDMIPLHGSFNKLKNMAAVDQILNM